jgi:hypothetical protein
MGKVLVGCEWTGITRQAFRDQGHDAWSCDLLPAEDGSPYHLQCDVRTVLECRWDLAVFHPPCTFLANSGARWWAKKQAEQQEALALVRLLLDAPIPHIALENPEGKIGSAIRTHDQLIHPWEYGEEEEKKTCLWLKHLPYLQPTKLMARREQKVWRMGKSKGRSQARARSYPGIARAMAHQWGRLISQHTEDAYATPHA